MTRDLRKFARQTNVRLFVGFFLILFVVGEGLIFLFYGREAAIFGLLCLIGGSMPLLLIGVILWIIELFVKRARDS